ncbi:hypothetical protein, partial [Streptomyces sp. SP18CS02]|uniref:hypothetical protein n=1 Tax=Streptomyces sp. SP18CS02 TaxID=3002531 RepID=UPI002E77AEAA
WRSGFPVEVRGTASSPMTNELGIAVRGSREEQCLSSVRLLSRLPGAGGERLGGGSGEALGVAVAARAPEDH